MRYSMSLFVIYFGTGRKYPRSRITPSSSVNATASFSTTSSTRNSFPKIFRCISTVPRYRSLDGPSWLRLLLALVPVPNQASGIDWTAQATPFRYRHPALPL